MSERFFPFPGASRLLGGFAAGVALLSSASAFGASVTLKPGDDVRTLTASLQPGDVITFTDGTYEIPSTLDWKNSGDLENTAPITFRAADGAAPILESTGGGLLAYVHDSDNIVIEGLIFSGQQATDNGEDRNFTGLQISNGDNIVVRNCEFRAVRGTAIYVPGDTTGLTIEHNRIHDTSSGSGIYLGYWNASTYVADSVVKNNWIYNIGGSNSYGIIIVGGSYNNQVVDNVVHAVDYRGLGFSGYTQGSGSSTAQPNIIERNAVWSVGNIGIESHGAALIRNNIVFQTGGYGIYSTPGDEDASAAQVITNNTVVDTLYEAIYYRQRIGSYVLANNALCNPLGYAVKFDNVEDEDLESVTVTNNVACGLVYVRDELKTGFLAGAGFADFVDVDLFDFWPNAAANLVDAGSSDALAQAPADDFNGTPRSSGAIDVGAYERSGETNPGWTIAEGFKEQPVVETPEPPTVETGCGGCTSSARGRAPVGELSVVVLGLLMMRRRRR